VAVAVTMAASLLLASCASTTPTTGTPSSARPTSTLSTGGTSAPQGSTAPPTSERMPPGTMVPVKATVTVEHEVAGAYRQGVAHTDDGGWVFSTNFALYRTDGALVEVAKNEAAIPAEWLAKGYNHIGDIDIVGNVIFAPVEQPDTDVGRQAMFRFDATTLQFLDAVEIEQHHNSFVSVDPESMTAYSTDFFDDDVLSRYDVRNGWKRLPQIKLNRKVGHIQGGDLANGAFWLSTDDDHDGLYRIDLSSGEVIDLGSVGHADGEGEGMDATETADGLLHVVSIDAKLLPVRFVELSVSPT
jgi:hypothetical protein